MGSSDFISAVCEYCSHLYRVIQEVTEIIIYKKYGNSEVYVETRSSQSCVVNMMEGSNNDNVQSIATPQAN